MRIHPRLRRIRIALALGSLLALPACLGDIFSPSTPQSPSAMARTAFGDALQWFTADNAGGWVMRPEISGSLVYFQRDMQPGRGTDEIIPSELVALERGTGALRWHRPIVSGENAAVAGNVVGVVWGALPMFDRETGAPRHTFAVGLTSLHSNVASDGARFYVGTHDGRVIAVDPATGQAAWQTNLAGVPNTAAYGVTVDGEAVAVALKHFGQTEPRDSGIVAVVERATGAPRWRTVVQGAVDPGIVEPPVIVGGLVIVVTMGHDVRAYDLQTGALRWQADVSFAAQEYGSSGLAACEGLVIVPTGDLGLVALDGATGAQRWRRGDLEEGSLFGVQCSHGTVMTRGSVSLQLFDARTGAHRARYPERLPVTADREFWITSVVRDEQFLYVGTTYGYAKVRAP